MSTELGANRPRRFLVDRMRSIEGIVSETVNAHVARAGFPGVSPAHGRLLAELRGGARPSELSRRLGITKGAIGQMVDRLEKRGYVTRSPDPIDGRAYLVMPTAKTEAAYRAGRKALLAIEEEWRRLLGPERMVELEEALETLDDWRP